MEKQCYKMQMSAESRGMKIAFVYFLFWPNIGGTEISMYFYAKELAKRGHKVTVFTANSIGFARARLPTVEVKDGILVKRFSFVPLPLRYVFFSGSFVRELMRDSTDVVFVFSLLPSFFTNVACMVARLRKIPLVLYPQFHPDRFSWHPELLKRAIGVFFDRWFAKSILRTADHIVTLTNGERQLYQKWGMPPSTTIYELIPKRKTSSAFQIANFKKKHALNDEDRILLFVGRLERRKGVDTLIEALPVVSKVFPSLKLLVVGDDLGFLSRYKEVAAQLNLDTNVIFAGRLDEEDLSAAYAVSDMVIVPSFFEAYGRTVGDAWTFAKPVIATRGVALKELIEEGGGLLFDYGDREALAKNITRLLSDRVLAEHLGNVGHKLLDKLADPEKCAEQLENILKRTVLCKLNERGD